MGRVCYDLGLLLTSNEKKPASIGWMQIVWHCWNSFYHGSILRHFLTTHRGFNLRSLLNHSNISHPLNHQKVTFLHTNHQKKNFSQVVSNPANNLDFTCCAFETSTHMSEANLTQNTSIKLCVCGKQPNLKSPAGETLNRNTSHLRGSTHLSVDHSNHSYLRYN